MQNAHLRLGQLDYVRSTANIQTKVQLHVDRYMGQKEQGHLLSVYGGDAEVGAIAAAIQENHPFTLTFPDGISKRICMGPDASCYRGALAASARNQTVRHLVAVSQGLHANGTAGQTYLLNYSARQSWAALVSLIGLPADPQWGPWVLDRLKTDGKIKQMDGIGCEPVAVLATRDTLMEEISTGLRVREICFPEVNGPVLWPAFKPHDALRPEPL